MAYNLQHVHVSFTTVENLDRVGWQYFLQDMVNENYKSLWSIFHCVLISVEWFRKKFSHEIVKLQVEKFYTDSYCQQINSGTNT